MKKFIIKFILFLIPVYVYFILVLITDPLNYFNLVNLRTGKEKTEVFLRSAKTMSYGSMLWKMNDFRRNPCQNIILGDSRTAGLDTALIHQLSGEKYYNLAVHGCSIEEIAELFWYANRLTPLKKVYITMSFQNYSETYRRNLFEKARKIYAFPIFIFTERFIVDLTWKNLKAAAFPAKGLTGQEDSLVAGEKRMQDHVKVIRSKLKKYTYSDENYRILQDISAYCRSNDIELSFINFPSYTAYYDLVKDLGLDEEDEKFRQDFAGLAPVYDFNYPNDITQDRNNYKDLHHMKKEVYNSMCREIWGGELKYARLSNPPSN